jgi:hypothetical protein
MYSIAESQDAHIGWGEEACACRSVPGGLCGCVHEHGVCLENITIITFYSPWGPHRPGRLCNSCPEWLDGVLAPPNLLMVLNVQVKSVLTQTCTLEGQSKLSN